MIQYLYTSKKSDPVVLWMRIHEKANQHRNAFCENTLNMAFTWTQKSKERQIDINLIKKRVFKLIGELSNSIAELSN